MNKMEINHGPVTWRKVQNTVSTRMVNLSFIHNLVPQQKLRRGTKILNNELKKLHGQKSYSQYVKIKTTVLRNLSDDSETYDSDTSTIEDYNSAPKNAEILEKCSDKNGTNEMRNSTVAAIGDCKSQISNSSFINLGWQRVIRKRKDLIENLDENVSEIVGPSSVSEDCIERSIGPLESSDLSGTSNELNANQRHEDTPLSPRTKTKAHDCSLLDSRETLGKNGTNKRWNDATDGPMQAMRNKNDCGNLHDSKDFKVITTVKRNIIPSLCNDQDTSVGGTNETDTNTHRLTNLHSLNQSKPLEKNGNNYCFSKEEGSYCQTHPRNSGVDQDFRDEPLGGGSHNQDVPLNDEDLDTVCQSDLENEGKMELENSTASQEKEAHMYKLPPKVMYTEIVNKKYKIISGEQQDQSSCTNENVKIGEDSSTDGCKSKSKNNVQTIKQVCSQQRIGAATDENNVEENISPSTKTRLGRLRRLNLTIDNESSSSDEDSYRLLVTRNLYDSGENATRKSMAHEKSRQTKCSESQNPVPKLSEDDTRLNASHAVRKVASDHLEPTKHGIEKRKKKKWEIRCNEKEESAIGQCQVEEPKINTAICKRPQNLQELIEQEDLLEERETASLMLNDICDNDVYILEIPKTVFDDKLLGNRIVLTEKRLKLGKQKYKILYRKVDTISCVFATGKSHKPYKTVNVKPAARIIARPKMAEM